MLRTTENNKNAVAGVSFMNILRKYTTKNDFPERSGQRTIHAERLGSFYKLVFIRHNETTTFVRLYSLTESEYEYLVTYFGRIINHSRLISEYFVSPCRNCRVVWIAENTKNYRKAMVWPSGYTDICDIKKGEYESLVNSTSFTFRTMNEWSVGYAEIQVDSHNSRVQGENRRTEIYS